MQESENKRPIGIAILSGLHIIGGAVGSVVVLLFLPKILDTPEPLDALASIGIPPILLLIAITFLLLLATVSGIGMWTGKTWGWFLGAFYYAYSIVRNLNTLIMTPTLLGSLPREDLAEITHGPAFYYAKHGGRVLVHTLLYLYFYKTNVRAYFNLNRQSKWKAAVAQFAVCILIAVTFSIAARLTSSSGRPESELVALNELFNRGEYERVVQGTSEYVKRHPLSYRGWSQLGWAHLKLDRMEYAQKCFHEAIELEPEWDNAYVGLGVLCRTQGNLAEARANYSKALALAPEKAEALSSLLVIELLDGNNAKAVEYGEKAWTIRKDDPSIAANLAVAYHYLGDTHKRDLFYNHAKRLGYRYLSRVQDIFDGKASIR